MIRSSLQSSKARTAHDPGSGFEEEDCSETTMHTSASQDAPLCAVEHQPGAKLPGGTAQGASRVTTSVNDVQLKPGPRLGFFNAAALSAPYKTAKSAAKPAPIPSSSQLAVSKAFKKRFTKGQPLLASAATGSGKRIRQPQTKRPVRSRTSDSDGDSDDSEAESEEESAEQNTPSSPGGGKSPGSYPPVKPPSTVTVTQSASSGNNATPRPHTAGVGSQIEVGRQFGLGSKYGVTAPSGQHPGSGWAPKLTRPSTAGWAGLGGHGARQAKVMQIDCVSAAQLFPTFHTRPRPSQATNAAARGSALAQTPLSPPSPIDKQPTGDVTQSRRSKACKTASHKNIPDLLLPMSSGSDPDDINAPGFYSPLLPCASALTTQGPTQARGSMALSSDEGRPLAAAASSYSFAPVDPRARPTALPQASIPASPFVRHERISMPPSVPLYRSPAPPSPLQTSVSAPLLPPQLSTPLYPDAKAPQHPQDGRPAALYQPQASIPASTKDQHVSVSVPSLPPPSRPPPSVEPLSHTCLTTSAQASIPPAPALSPSQKTATVPCSRTLRSSHASTPLSCPLQVITPSPQQASTPGPPHLPQDSTIPKPPCPDGAQFQVPASKRRRAPRTPATSKRGRKTSTPASLSSLRGSGPCDVALESDLADSSAVCMTVSAAAVAQQCRQEQQPVDNTSCMSTSPAACQQHQEPVNNTSGNSCETTVLETALVALTMVTCPSAPANTAKQQMLRALAQLKKPGPLPIPVQGAARVGPEVFLTLYAPQTVMLQLARVQHYLYRELLRQCTPTDESQRVSESFLKLLSGTMVLVVDCQDSHFLPASTKSWTRGRGPPGMVLRCVLSATIKEFSDPVACGGDLSQLPNVHSVFLKLEDKAMNEVCLLRVLDKHVYDLDIHLVDHVLTEYKSYIERQGHDFVFNREGLVTSAHRQRLLMQVGHHLADVVCLRARATAGKGSDKGHSAVGDDDSLTALAQLLAMPVLPELITSIQQLSEGTVTQQVTAAEDQDLKSEKENS